MSASQERVQAFFFREAPGLGFLLLYAIGFLALSVFLDVWELFDPGTSPLNHSPGKYLFTLTFVGPFWHAYYRHSKKRLEEV